MPQHSRLQITWEEIGAIYDHLEGPHVMADTTNIVAIVCFTFGSDLPEHWPLIAQTVDGDQSRVIAPPGGGGAVVLSRLGRRLQEEASSDYQRLPT